MDRNGLLCGLGLALALAAGCSQDPEVAKREFVASGDRFVAEGKVTEALIEYRNAVQQDPLFAEAREKLADSLVKTGDLAGAYQQYIRIADLKADDAGAQLKAGQFHLLARKFEDARASAEKALGIDPTLVDAQILKGNALGGLQDFQSAIAEVQRAIDADPDRGLAIANLGALQMASGDAKLAEEAFKRAVTVSPTVVETHLALVNLYLSTNRLAEADAALEAAAKLHPRNPLVNRTLGLLYVSTRRAEQAEAPFKRVVEEMQDLDSKLMLADYYRGTGRPEQALPILEEAASMPGGFSSANTRKAVLLFGQSKAPEAKAALESVLAKDPDYPQALVVKSIVALLENRRDEALALAQQVTARDPNSLAGQLLVGRVQSMRREPESAIEAYNAALKISPRLAAAHVELAKLHLQTGRPAEALKFAEEAVRLQPTNAEALLLKSRAEMATGNVSNAAETMKPFDGSPLVGAAEVQAQLGTLKRLQRDLPAARAAYTRALEADPANIEAVTGLTLLDIEAGNKAAAKARADAAANNPRVSAAGLVYAGRTYLALQDSAAAERALRQAVEKDPNHLEAYGLLGTLMARLQRLDAAIADFEEVGKRQPRSVVAPTIIGMLLEAQGKQSEAMARYEAALAIDARAAVAANNLAWILAESGANLDRALELAQTAKAGLPESPDVSDTLAWVYHKKGMSNMAVDPLRQALKARPTDPLFLYHLGMVHAANGDQTEARAALRQALSISTTFPGANDARQMLTKLGG